MNKNDQLRKVYVPLGDNSYTIYIDEDVLKNEQLMAPYITSKQVCIVTNRVVAELYLATLTDTLKKVDPALQLEIVTLPEGEAHKNQSSLDLIHDCLIENKFSRDCLIIALGGGIVGDITGFAAATYQRGANFIQIPTTLLAQVDSSVGGKTAINHRLGKNLIGAFHQPNAVFIDTSVLNTLPKREISAGMAEVIKYGLIRDYPFLVYLDKVMEKLMELSPMVMAEIIQLACQHKSDVVAADEREQGQRATLNLGHTFGHAIETLTQYNTYLHGEAVAIGTMMSLKLSQKRGWLTSKDLQFAEQLFKRANCPIDLSESQLKLTKTAIRDTMQRDKKVRAGQLKLVLLKNLGKAIICSDSAEEQILQAISAYS